MTTSNFIYASRPLQKAQADMYSIANGDPIRFDMTDVLPAGAVISSATITVNKSTTPALSFGNAAANSPTYTDPEGETVGIGKAVESDCSGGEAPTDYVVKVVATLDNGSHRGKKFFFQVRQGPPRPDELVP